MQVVYATQPFPTRVQNQIFLAGPTPRDNNVKSWRPEAIQLLQSLGYEGTVFVPEDASGQYAHDYSDQIEWEQAAIRRSDCVLYWVPRELETMPAFTTNVEFGDNLHLGNMVYGRPTGAPKTRYLDVRAADHQIPVHENLRATCVAAIKMAGPISTRNGGEVTVPNYIWTTSAFRQWHLSMKNAGNKLQHVEPLWVFRIPSKPELIFSFAMKAHVYVKEEDRVKDNEFVLSRTDIGAAVLYYKPPDGGLIDVELVLVREFRTPARNRTGFVLELPSGSSLKPATDMYDVAITELVEETGLELSRDRFKMHSAHQLAGTWSSHKAWVVSAELTQHEIEQIKKNDGKLVVGESPTERTYVHVLRLDQLLTHQDVDFATIGMIIRALTHEGE